MKYMGSKARFSKEILPIILKDRKPDQFYVEPLCGGCNTIDKVDGNRIANDVNAELIDMWKALLDGWIPPKVEREEYTFIKLNKDAIENHIVGWVGFNCSYSGKYFGGFAGKTKTKIGTIRDYQKEAINNVKKQISGLRGVEFSNTSYSKVKIPKNSIIYCDPPYENTTKYNDDFNHIEFWEWVREMDRCGHSIFVSEYNAPDDFMCIWSKKAKSSLSANGSIGGNKDSVEKLFVPKSYYDN